MDTDLLGDLIVRKHQVLSQLYELTHRQVGFVHQGDIPRLLGLLAAKQNLLAEFQDVEQRLDPFRRQDPESRRWRSAADRQRARQTAQECESLLADTLQLEKQCETELIQRRDKTAARLQGVHDAACATKAYARSPARRGGQLDVSSET